MELDFIRNHITQLQLIMGISEHRMSLELGHSRNYIRNITSGRSLTSVQELNICEYLNVQPSAFFDEDKEECLLVQRALEGMRDLPDKDLIITFLSLSHTCAKMTHKVTKLHRNELSQTSPTSRIEL